MAQEHPMQALQAMIYLLVHLCTLRLLSKLVTVYVSMYYTSLFDVSRYFLLIVTTETREIICFLAEACCWRAIIYCLEVF